MLESASTEENAIDFPLCSLAQQRALGFTVKKMIMNVDISGFELVLQIHRHWFKPVFDVAKWFFENIALAGNSASKMGIDDRDEFDFGARPPTSFQDFFDRALRVF